MAMCSKNPSNKLDRTTPSVHGVHTKQIIYLFIYLYFSFFQQFNNNHYILRSFKKTPNIRVIQKENEFVSEVQDEFLHYNYIFSQVLLMNSRHGQVS